MKQYRIQNADEVMAEHAKHLKEFRLAKKNLDRTQAKLDRRTKESEIKRLKSITESRAKLQSVKPDEWLNRINSIKDFDTKIRVACIVFWDFFGEQSGGNTPAELQGLLDEYRILNFDNEAIDKRIAELSRLLFEASTKRDKIASEQGKRVCDGLFSIGYSKAFAELRSKEPRK